MIEPVGAVQSHCIQVNKHILRVCSQWHICHNENVYMYKKVLVLLDLDRRKLISL